MNIEQFRREVENAAQGNTTSATAQAERALRRKDFQKCAHALNQFAAASLASTDRGERPCRAVLPPELLPPVV
jgi:hypothetical protein